MKHTSQKGFIVPIIIAIIAVLAVGAYAYQNHKKSAVAPAPVASQTSTQSNTPAPADSAPTQSEGTFANLLALGESQKCDVPFDIGNGASTKGTVYISKGQMRGDYSASMSGQTFGIHFITDTKDSYTWMDGIAMGFKSAINTTTAVDTTAPAKSSSQGFNVNQKVKYSCAPWSEDRSLFVVPTSINFTSTAKAAASPKSGYGY